MASKFKPTIVTQEYVNALNASVVSGQPVIITKAIASNTPLSDAQASSLTAEQAKTVVVNQTAELKGAVRIDADASQLLVRARLSNEAITSDYQLNSLLLYGTYAGKDILVAVTRTVSPEIMPAYDETSPVAIEVNIYLKANAQGDATVQVATAGLATMEAVNDVRDYVNGPFDAKMVHLAGSETISGDKTFTKPVKATSGVVGDVIGNVTGRADLATEAVHAAATDHAKVSDQATEATHAGKADEATHATNADQATHANAADIATKLSHLISVNDQTVDTSNGVANVIKGDPQVHELAVNGDFNNYTTAGLWQSGLSANVVAMANHPGNGVAGALVVLQTAGVVQLFIEYTEITAPGNIWKRGCYHDQWTPWLKQAAPDGQLVHNTGNEVITGSKTFSQNVVGGLATREFPKGVKLADVATAMDQYNGNWFVRGDNVPSDLPPQLKNWFTISVIAGNSPTTGMILLNGFENNIRVITTVNNQMISGWQKLPDDAAVMHKGDTANPTMNVLAANSDFNSYTTGGVWQNANSGPIKTMANYPGDGVAGALVVLETAGPVQIFIEYIDANVTTGNGSIWKRGCYYGKWSPWMKQAADDNKLVHNTGNETIAGVKTFAQQLKANGGVVADGNLDLSAGSHKLSLNNNGQLMLDQRQIANPEYGNLTTIDIPDFNALLTPGNYSLTHPSGGKNGPGGITDWGRLEVRAVGTAINQRFTTDVTGLVFTRTYYNSAWSPWVETVTDDASVVHRTGTETIAGPKTFTSPIIAPNFTATGLTGNGVTMLNGVKQETWHGWDRPQWWRGQFGSIVILQIKLAVGIPDSLKAGDYAHVDLFTLPAEAYTGIDGTIPVAIEGMGYDSTGKATSMATGMIISNGHAMLDFLLNGTGRRFAGEVTFWGTV